MATSSTEQLESGVADEDRSDFQDGKDKKKKIKPFEAFRRLFKSTRKRNKGKDDPQVSIVSMKAKSTTALHSTSNDDEGDDDGGFKGNRPLQGTRSISEDSVFNPELKEANPEALKKTAVSEENLPKSTFQAELFAKIKSRQSMCSDEDDPGLPHSPTPPVTTADIIMGGGLKPLPVSGKSMSRESETSLISEDGSDNDEDDTFNRDWRNSVAAVTSSRVGQSPTKAEKGMLDFSSMQSTEILDSKLSKDKLSVKPMRRSRAPSRKKKTEDKTTKPLPEVKEESPTKLQSESIFDTEVPTKSQLSSSLPSRFPEKSDDKLPCPPDGDAKIATTKVVTSTSNTSSQNKTVESGHKDSDSVNKDNNLVKLRSSSLKTDVAPSVPSNIERQSDLSNAFGKLKKTNGTDISESAKSELKSVDVRPKELKIEVTEKTTKSTEQKENSPTRNEEDKDSSDASTKVPASLRTTKAEDSATSSPKEEYKIKRQNRSKTLPGSSEAVKIEEAAAKVQRANSQRVDADNSPRVDVTKRQSVMLPVTPAHKPADTKRLSWVEQSSKSSGEPDWLANLKKKKAVKDEKSPTEETKSVVSNKSEEKKAESSVKTNVNVKPTSFSASKSSFTKPVEIKASKPVEIKTTKPVEVVKGSSYKASESKQSDTSNDKSSSNTVESKKVTTPTSSEPKTAPLAESKKVTTPIANEAKTTPFGPSKLNNTKTEAKPESKPSSSAAVSTASTTTSSATKSSIADRINSLKGSSTSDSPKPAPSEKSTANSTGTTTKPVTTPVVSKSVTTPVSRFSTPVASPTKTAVSKTFSGLSSNKTSDATASSAVKPAVVSKTQPFSQTKSVSSTTVTATPKPSSTVSKDSTSSSSQSDVPAWRRNIQTKKLESSNTSGSAPLKIELIENTALTTKPEKKAVEPKNSTSVQSTASAGKCTEAGNKKATSVLDMVKNFNKLEVN